MQAVFNCVSLGHVWIAVGLLDVGVLGHDRAGGLLLS